MRQAHSITLNCVANTTVVSGIFTIDRDTLQVLFSNFMSIISSSREVRTLQDIKCSWASHQAVTRLTHDSVETQSGVKSLVAATL